MIRTRFFSKLSRPALVVAGAMLLFVLFFGTTNWLRQVNMLTAQFDMGNMDQTLWHSLHGRWFQMTDPGSAKLVLRTTIHADYLLLAYLPFYALWPDPRLPLLLQVLAVASGAIPLFWLARQRLGQWLSAAVAVGYLLYPPLQWGMTFDVHAVVLVAPLLLWAWWAATTRRWWIYGLTAGLALLGKEEVGVVVAAMGLYWVWRRGYRWMGAASIVAGLGWSALMLGWAIPSARGDTGHFALSFYSDYGDSSFDIVLGVLTHPGQVLRELFRVDGLVLIRTLLFPVAGLALAGLPVLLVALPELAINLLSNNTNQHTIFFQYQSVIVPLVFLATVDGLVRIRGWWLRWRGRELNSRWLTGGLLLTALVGAWLWSPLPGTRHHRDAMNAFRTSTYRADVNLAAASITPTDRLAVTNNLAPQFSRRDAIWGFPNNLDQADAIVALEGSDFELRPKEEISRLVRALQSDDRFQLIHQREGFWYYRRR